MNLILKPELADEISAYYAIHNIEAGERLLDEFEARCKYLVNFPKIGKSDRTLRANFRGISFSG
jgi:toxin ParE1/3/4